MHSINSSYIPSPAIASPSPQQWVKLNSFPNLLLHFSTISRSKIQIWPFSEFYESRINPLQSNKGLENGSYLRSQTWQQWGKCGLCLTLMCLISGWWPFVSCLLVISVLDACNLASSFGSASSPLEKGGRGQIWVKCSNWQNIQVTSRKAYLYYLWVGGWKDKHICYQAILIIWNHLIKSSSVIWVIEGRKKLP